MKNHRGTSYFPPLFCTPDFSMMCPFTPQLCTIQRSPQKECQKQWVRTCLKPVCPLFCDLKPFKIDNFFWTTKPGRTWILKTNLILHGAFHFASNLLHCIKLQAGRVKQSKNPLRDLQLFKGFRVCFFFGGPHFLFPCQSLFNRLPAMHLFQRRGCCGCSFLPVQHVGREQSGFEHLVWGIFGQIIDDNKPNKQTTCFFRIHIFLLQKIPLPKLLLSCSSGIVVPPVAGAPTLLWLSRWPRALFATGARKTSKGCGKRL